MRALLIIVFGFFSLMPYLVHGQSSFVVNDVLAADPGASIIDPEYNVDLNMVCWQSDDEELWVCSLDPITHLFVPSDGRGMKVDYDLTPPTFGGWNGPEWMLSQGTTQIVYNQKKGGHRYPGIATQILGGWATSTLMQYEGALYAMATRNYEDSTGMFLFESNTYDGIRWVRSNDLNNCSFYPDITLGFFADDEQQICCALNHSRQPGYLEVATTLPFFTQISNDTIGAPFMWNDPESNSRMFMYRTNGNQTVKIFQENADGNWYLYHSFNSPLPSPFIYITSPEPFVYKGHSYISFMAAQAPMGLSEMPAEIWISSINPMNPLMRRVSDSTSSIRIDPEPVVIGDSAFVYYTEKVHTRWWYQVHRVRKCTTGLETLFTETKEVEPSSGNSVNIFPNPAIRQCTITSALLEQTGSKIIQIIEPSGKLVRTYRTGLNTFNADLSGIPCGLYIVKISNDRRSAVSRLVITH